MAVKFLSQHWAEEMTVKLQESFNTNGNVSIIFVQVVTDTPENVQKWMFLSLVKGKFVSYEVGEGKPPKYELSAIGTYNTFKKIIRGELNGAKGITSGELKLGGNVLKSMGLLWVYEKIEEAQRSIETEF